MSTYGNEGTQLNGITDEIIGAALRVHGELGQGILASACEACLTFDLLDRRLTVERPKALPLVYRGQYLDCGYRIDLLVEQLVIVEVKSIEKPERIRSAQLTSYLRLCRLKVGLLINFNVRYLMRDGVRRIVNGFPD